MRKLKFGLVIAMGFAGVLGASIPATASATPTSALEQPAIDAAAVNTFQHVQSGLCLDGSVSSGVRLKACNGGTYQQWNVQEYQVKHVQSGLCLDGSVSNGPILKACNGSAYQQWYTSSGLDFVHAQSGLCLDGSVSNGVRLKDCNGSTYQQWV